MRLRNAVRAHLRHLRVIALSAGLLVVSFALLAHGASKPGVVKTRNGQTYEGDVEQRPDGSVVVTSKSGVVVKIERENIASVETLGKSFMEEFNQRRQKLDPTDVKGRLDLARFALDQKQYQLAMLMVDEAMDLSPNDQDAATLRETIRQQARLERQHPPATAPGGASGGATGGATSRPGATTGGTAQTDVPGPATAPEPGAPRPFERRLVTADDIQTIRRAELKSGDGARVAIPNDVRRAYATKAGVSFAAFNGKPQVEQALEILSKGDDSMRKQVRISSDPDAIVRFKQIQPMILNGCATNACHGNVSGGALVLFPAESDAATYTNFYILSKYAKSLEAGGGGKEAGTGGFFGGSGDKKLIDRGHGDQSLLVQYGLPENKATLKHPKVTNFRPFFRDRDDQQARRIVGWMNDVLKMPEPSYELDYPLPWKHSSGSAPAPTSQPAGG